MHAHFLLQLPNTSQVTSTELIVSKLRDEKRLNTMCGVFCLVMLFYLIVYVNDSQGD